MDLLIALLFIIIITGMSYWIFTISVGKISGVPAWMPGALTALVFLILLGAVFGGYTPFFPHRVLIR